MFGVDVYGRRPAARRQLHFTVRLFAQQRVDFNLGTAEEFKTAVFIHRDKQEKLF